MPFLHHLEHQKNNYSRVMETIKVSKSSFNGGVQQSKLNITEHHQISYNIASKQYNQGAIFSSPNLGNSPKIHACQFNLKKCTVEDNEISIFDARKYFNEGDEQFPNSTTKPSPERITEQNDLAEFSRDSSVSSSVGTYSAGNYGARFVHATPTASSEASWNSQTGLLSNPPGAIKVSLQSPIPIIDEKKKNNGPRRFFGGNCPCIGKKTIEVDDKTVPSDARSPIHFQSITPTNLSKETDKIPKEISPAGKTTTPNSHRLSTDNDQAAADPPPIRITLTAGRSFNEGAGFSFPILNSSKTSQAVTTSKKNHNHRTAEVPPRSYLEIFRPHNHETPSPKTTTEKLIEDDTASDGSSDLFELENFSTQTSYQMYNNNNHNFRLHSLDEAANFRNSTRLSVITTTATVNGGIYRRNSLEEPATPSVAPTEGYEPSEKSIDWSVTTAEGFDRASVTTFEEMMVTDRDDRDGGGRRNSGGSRGNGLLGLGCRSDKAVLVGPGLLRVGPGYVSSLPVPYHENWAYNKPPLAGRSEPAHRR